MSGGGSSGNEADKKSSSKMTDGSNSPKSGDSSFEILELEL